MSNTAVQQAENAILEIERDIAALAAPQADLAGKRTTLRDERVQAARVMLLGGGPRKVWRDALQAEQEADALLDDAAAVAKLLERELRAARVRAESAKNEAYLAALRLRLHQVAIEQNFTIPDSGEFFQDVAAAYERLSAIGRSDVVDRKHAMAHWLDRAGHVSTAAFSAAVWCHGDIAIETGDYHTSFGLADWNGRAAASLPLNSSPTPAVNRALWTKVLPTYSRSRGDFVGHVQP